MNRKDFLDELSKLRAGSTFIVLHKYVNEAGEISDFNLLFHMSYENAVKRSMKIVHELKPGSPLEAQARNQVIMSLNESLAKIGTLTQEEIEPNYHYYTDEAGKKIEGVKLHIESDTLHVFGLAHQKKVLTPVKYPVRNSGELTIAKNKIRRLCPISRFRQFKVVPNRLEKMVVQKTTLLPPGDVFDQA